ncbi:MAG: hypothetical protein ACOC1U_07100 [Spirochaetota bacterium]
MAQFYLLSVATLLFGGLLAASEFLGERFSAFAPLAELAERRKFALTVGAITAIVGILKLFVRAPFDTVPVAGDLLPAIAGIATGSVLLLANTRRRESVGEELPPSQASAIVEYRSPIGLAGAIVGLLHFIFPGTVIF